MSFDGVNLSPLFNSSAREAEAWLLGFAFLLFIVDAEADEAETIDVCVACGQIWRIADMTAEAPRVCKICDHATCTGLS